MEWQDTEIEEEVPEAPTEEKKEEVVEEEASEGVDSDENIPEQDVEKYGL